jgi:Ca2+-binding RTX toxin-like protein
VCDIAEAALSAISSSARSPRRRNQKGAVIMSEFHLRVVNGIRLERLEQRRLLSAEVISSNLLPRAQSAATTGSIIVNSVVENDYVVIDGTSRSDRILIEPDGADLRVTVNKRAPARILGTASGIWVRGGAGNDTILIEAHIPMRARLEGGDGTDTLTGGSGTDVIIGGDGNDLINGGARNDTIDGGAGNDTIDGSKGQDRIDGGDGRDSILGHAGNDVINGSEGDDRIDGGTGNDSINGGGGNDTIHGGDSGNEMLNGGDGDDRIYALDGLHVIKAGAGDDYIEVGAGIDRRSTVDGGVGFDELFNWDHSPDNVRRIEDSSTFVENIDYGGGGCFLTTAVVHWAGKRDECEELTLLRRFRDTFMRGLSEGQDMIRDYYTHAPRVVRAIENNGLGGIEWPLVFAMVQTAIAHIRAGRNAAALRVYSAEYLRLKGRYILGNHMMRRCTGNRYAARPLLVST